jgi:plastocyanin
MNRNFKTWRIAGIVVVTAVAAGLYCWLAPASSKAAPPQNVAGYTVQTGPGGTVSGKILYQGKPVSPKKVTVTQDRSACGNMKEIFPVEINGGGIADAVVWIDDISKGKSFSYPAASLDQKGCMFMPHVVLMAPGKLKVLNSDSVAHNVHIFSKANRGFNQVMPPGGEALSVSLFRPDTVIVRCDVHTWMQAYVVVAKNPYYVLSGNGGSFELTDVPPGTYHLSVWQETLGTKTQEITVQQGKTTSVNFTLRK